MQYTVIKFFYAMLVLLWCGLQQHHTTGQPRGWEVLTLFPVFLILGSQDYYGVVYRAVTAEFFAPSRYGDFYSG